MSITLRELAWKSWLAGGNAVAIDAEEQATLRAEAGTGALIEAEAGLRFADVAMLIQEAAAFVVEHEGGIFHFDTGVYSGPRSEHFARRREQARSWLSVNSSLAVQDRLERYIEFLGSGSRTRRSKRSACFSGRRARTATRVQSAKGET